MKPFTVLLWICVVTSAFSVCAAPVRLPVDLPAEDVLVVRVASQASGAYAEAYGKLVGHYAQSALHIHVRFPQRSVSLHGQRYAAIGVQGSAPLASVVSDALGHRMQIDAHCGVRIAHLNSPDDTPTDRLRHVIFVPVTGAPPGSQASP